jgi:hypothetical protein
MNKKKETQAHQERAKKRRRKKRMLAFALLALQVRQYIYELYLVNE